MPQCMEKYKNDFAIEFAKVMQKNLLVWKELQKTYTRHLYGKEWITGYIISFLCGFIPGRHERNYDVRFHFWLAVALFIGSIITAISVENKDYQKDIKKDLFPKLLKVFGKDIKYGAGGDFYSSSGPVYSSGYISNSVYDNSMLFKKPVSSDSADDKFTGVYNDCPFTISESEVTNIQRYKNGKSDTTQLFKGVAMHFKMQKKVKSRVLIYSKGLFDKVPDDFEKVEFEYEKFNKKYNVYVQKSKDESRGQIEARYLFNTAFMDRFMQLHTSFRISKMQCSIYEDSVLILLSTNKDLFEMNHLFCRIDDINQYKKLFDEFASVFSFLEILNLSSKTGL